MKFSKGFTLIELLVVIAIIGILSSVVLASLSTARAKGNDAKVKEQLSSLRSAAEIYYNGAGNNTYGANGTVTCATGMFLDTQSGMATIMGASSWPSGSSPVCIASTTGYRVYAPLTGTTGSFACVDSIGNSTTTTATPNGLNNACQ
jgi:prepilin-type N-terminal cleavage/methylation domain-containing protein